MGRRQIIWRSSSEASDLLPATPDPSGWSECICDVVAHRAATHGAMIGAQFLISANHVGRMQAYAEIPAIQHDDPLRAREADDAG